MRNRLLIIASLLSLLAPAALRAEPSISIQNEASPREVYIGDRIQYNLAVTFSTDVALAPVDFSSLGDFELLSISSMTTKAKDAEKFINGTTIILTTFSTGTLRIPAFTVRFASPGVEPQEAKTQEIEIKVKSVLEEKGDLGNLQPLKGLYNFPSYLWVWILLGILIAAGLVYLGWRLRKKKGPDEKPAAPPRPPEEVAWEALHALEDADLISQGHTKEFYFRLSVILREYLEGRFQISAIERTTSELLTNLRDLKFNMELTSICREFFDNADLVKFAKFTPTEEEIAGDLNRVKKFLNLTMPAKEESKTEKAEEIPV